MTNPVNAQRFENIEDAAGTPGAFAYFARGNRDPAGIVFLCPCGCGFQATLPFGAYDPPRLAWEWDGNFGAPTLHPPIGRVSHWTGTLTAGVWTAE